MEDQLIVEKIKQQRCLTSLTVSEKNKVMILLAVDRMRAAMQDAVKDIADTFHRDSITQYMLWYDNLEGEVASNEEKMLKIKEIWQRGLKYCDRNSKKDLLNWQQSASNRAQKSARSAIEQFKNEIRVLEQPLTDDRQSKAELKRKKKLEDKKAQLLFRENELQRLLQEDPIPKDVWDSMRICVSAISANHFEADMSLQDSANLLRILDVMLPPQSSLRSFISHIQKARNLKSHEREITDAIRSEVIHKIVEFLTELFLLFPRSKPGNDWCSVHFDSISIEEIERRPEVFEEIQRAAREPRPIWSQAIPNKDMNFSGRKDVLANIAKGFHIICSPQHDSEIVSDHMNNQSSHHNNDNEDEKLKAIQDMDSLNINYPQAKKQSKITFHKEKIDQNKVEGGKILSQTIIGMGGMGKTYIATEYCHKYRNHYSTGIFWINADTLASIDKSFRDIAVVDMGFPVSRYDDSTLSEDTRRKLLLRDVYDALLLRSGWLIVFDNADNPSTIVSFLPPTRSHGEIHPLVSVTTAPLVKDMKTDVKQELSGESPINNINNNKNTINTINTAENSENTDKNTDTSERSRGIIQHVLLTTRASVRRLRSVASSSIISCGVLNNIKEIHLNKMDLETSMALLWRGTRDILTQNSTTKNPTTGAINPNGPSTIISSRTTDTVSYSYDKNSSIDTPRVNIENHDNISTESSSGSKSTQTGRVFLIGESVCEDDQDVLTHMYQTLSSYTKEVEAIRWLVGSQGLDGFPLSLQLVVGDINNTTRWRFCGLYQRFSQYKQWFSQASEVSQAIEQNNPHITQTKELEIIENLLQSHSFEMYTSVIIKSYPTIEKLKKLKTSKYAHKVLEGFGLAPDEQFEFLDMLNQVDSEVQIKKTVRRTFLSNYESIERLYPCAAEILRLCAFLSPDDIPLDMFKTILNNTALKHHSHADHLEQPPATSNTNIIDSAVHHSQIEKNSITKTMSSHCRDINNDPHALSTLPGIEYANKYLFSPELLAQVNVDDWSLLSLLEKLEDWGSLITLHMPQLNVGFDSFSIEESPSHQQIETHHCSQSERIISHEKKHNENEEDGCMILYRVSFSMHRVVQSVLREKLSEDWYNHSSPNVQAVGKNNNHNNKNNKISEEQRTNVKDTENEISKEQNGLEKTPCSLVFIRSLQAVLYMVSSWVDLLHHDFSDTESPHAAFLLQLTSTSSYSTMIACHSLSVYDLNHFYYSWIAHIGLYVGWARYRYSRYYDADVILQQVLKLNRSIYGQSCEDTTAIHADIALSLERLGAVRESMGDYSSALDYLSQALYMYRSFYGSSGEDQSVTHSSIARTLDQLGSLSSSMGDYKKSEMFFSQSVDMEKKIHNVAEDDDEGLFCGKAQLLNNRGNTLILSQNYTEALACFQQSVLIQRLTHGEDENDISVCNHDICCTLDGIGLAHAGLFMYEEALSYHTQALRMGRKLFGNSEEDNQEAQHSSIASSLKNLGSLHKLVNNASEALNYFHQSLEMWQRIHQNQNNNECGNYPDQCSGSSDTQNLHNNGDGDELFHPSFASIYHSMAEIHQDNGNYTEALKYYQKSLRIREDTKNFRQFCITLDNIGCLHRDFGYFDLALEAYQHSLSVARQINGKNDDGTDIDTDVIAQILNFIGNNYFASGKPDEAFNAFLEAYQMNQRIHGKNANNTDIACNLDGMGKAKFATSPNNAHEAREYLVQSLQMKQNIIFTNIEEFQSSVTSTLPTLSYVYHSLGDQPAYISSVYCLNISNAQPSDPPEAVTALALYSLYSEPFNNHYNANNNSNNNNNSSGNKNKSKKNIHSHNNEIVNTYSSSTDSGMSKNNNNNDRSSTTIMSATCCNMQCMNHISCNRLLTCSKCAFIRYCSTDCQRADWMKHKSYCKKIQPTIKSAKMSLLNMSVIG